MNSAVINIKVKPDIKKQAQKITEELGFSLSAVLNAYLRELIQTKKISFSLREEPSEYLINELKEAKQDRKNGRVSPVFDNADDAITYLKRNDK